MVKGHYFYTTIFKFNKWNMYLFIYFIKYVL